MIGESWRDEVATGAYPFSDGVSRTSDTGKFIAQGTFLDAAICLVGGAGPLYLSQIDVSAQGITVHIGDQNERLAASGTFEFGSESGLIELTDISGRPAGIMVSEPGRLALFTSWDDGSYTFDTTETEFAAKATMCPPIQGVSELRDASDTAVNGTVWLVGDDGVVLREVNGAIRVDIIGDPLFRRRLCGADGSIDEQRYVKYFGGLQPNSAGEVSLVVNEHESGSVIRINSAPAGIEISTIGG